MPAQSGKSREITKPMNVWKMLPDTQEYYRYNGSLTPPPCTEGVLWLVLKQSSSVSAQQIEQFRHVIGVDNNRPLQMLDARTVLK